MVLIKEASHLSFKNKTRLTSEEASCYYCLNTFKVRDIVDWVDKDQTALCPKCGIDSVLDGIVEDETLKKIHIYYFKTFI